MTLELPKITCTSTRCEDELHCYLQKRASGGSVSGPCRTCGTNLVSWDRVHVRNLADVSHTFTMMKTELIRHKYWHVDIHQGMSNNARRKGWINLRVEIDKRLQKALAPAHPPREGIQTPFKTNNVIHYAQHATATCCRKCVEEWHGIPRGRDMTKEEIAYCATLITLYIEERLPDLIEKGEKIPYRRQQSKDESEAILATRKPTARQQMSAALRAKQQRRASDDDN
jgi:hypothetical protein